MARFYNIKPIIESFFDTDIKPNKVNPMTIIATYFVILILALLTIFQICLVFGLPYGEFAWGGQHKILPKNLRISSVVSIVIYFLISFVLLSKSGILQIFSQSESLKTTSLVIAIYFSLGIPLNLISRSKKERFTMTPIVTILAILCWMIV